QAKDQTLHQFNKNLEKKVAERTLELEIVLKEQKEAERRVSEKNMALSQALEELNRTKGALINLNNELERRVEDRTKEVVAREIEVNVKNQELEKVNVDLDNFIYTASHDLKSPISNLEGLVSILMEELEGVDNPKVHQYLDMMNVSTTKLRNTILDLAEITKVQKNLEENPVLVSFREIVEDIKEELSITANSTFIIEQKLEVEEIVYPIHGLRSVLHNLLSNAIKYQSAERQIHVTVSTHKENDS